MKAPTRISGKDPSMDEKDGVRGEAFMVSCIGAFVTPLGQTIFSAYPTHIERCMAMTSFFGHVLLTLAIQMG